ncbi:phage tail protein, partial [Vibrio agarivorans]
MEKLRTIRLYGILGSRFGRTFRLAVSTPAEAVRALAVQIPG